MQVNRRNIILIILLLTVAVLLVLASTLLSVQEIIIRGNLTAEQSLELKEYVNTLINKGDSVFAVDKNYVIRCIETNKNFAELKVEKLERELPDKIAISISKRTARYYFGNGPYYILDSELKVINKQTEKPGSNLKEIEFIIAPVLPVAHKVNDDILRGYTELLEGTGAADNIKPAITAFREKIQLIRKDTDLSFTIRTDRASFVITHINNKGIAGALGQIINCYNNEIQNTGDIFDINVDANGSVTTFRR